MDDFMAFIKEHFVKILSYLISLYFIIIFHCQVGFPPSGDLDKTSTTYLMISILFFLIPIAQKISIGKILSFEAKAEKLNEDVQEFKRETRETLSIYNNLINTVSNTINQSVIVNIPSYEKLENAKKVVKDFAVKEGAKIVTDNVLEQYIAAEDDDIMYALSRLRTDMERSLRSILKKRIITSDPSKMKKKYYSVGKLFSLFIEELPQYNDINQSFRYVLQICNAAVHGQSISKDNALEGLAAGLEILNILKPIEEKYG